MTMFRVTIVKEVIQDVLIEAETAEDAAHAGRQGFGSVLFGDDSETIVDVIAIEDSILR